jgi:hypothetical protein
MAVRAQGRTERRRVLARELAAALAPFGVEVDRLARPPAGLARATFLVGPADARVVAKLAPREAGAEMPSGCGCCAPWSRRTRSCRVR